jgi:hypothetical protein
MRSFVILESAGHNMLTLVANSRWKRLSQLCTQTSMICGGGEESQQTVGQQGTVIDATRVRTMMPARHTRALLEVTEGFRHLRASLAPLWRARGKRVRVRPESAHHAMQSKGLLVSLNDIGNALRDFQDGEPVIVLARRSRCLDN